MNKENKGHWADSTNQAQVSTNQIKVSIIVIFNRILEDKLQRLCNSLKPQLSADVEVIFVQEDLGNILLPPLSIPVRHITIPAQQGIPFNRNQGIKQARGKIVIFIDDDCWVTDNWLSAMVKNFEDEKVMAVTSGTKIPPSNFFGDCISALGFPGGGSLGFEQVWKVSENNFTNHLAVGNCALRREIFDQIGLFDESMKSGAEDAELSFRMEKAGIFIKYEPEAYAFHEARTTISSFAQWQLRRGRANYQFKQKVGNVGSFVKLRLWSAKNVLKMNVLNPRMPVVISLLAASFFLQQVGFFWEKRRQKKME